MFGDYQKLLQAQSKIACKKTLTTDERAALKEASLKVHRHWKNRWGILKYGVKGWVNPNAWPYDGKDRWRTLRFGIKQAIKPT